MAAIASPLGVEGERVLPLPPDRPPLGHVLGRLAHRIGVVDLGEGRVDEPPAEGRVVELAGAAIPGRIGLGHDVRRPGHRLDAAADEHVAVADCDGVGRRVDRLQPAAAQPVDGQPADLDRQAGQEDGHPRDIAVVLAGLIGAAEDDVLDARGVDARAIDDGPQDERPPGRRDGRPRGRRRTGRSASGRPRRSTARGAADADRGSTTGVAPDRGPGCHGRAWRTGAASSSVGAETANTVSPLM